MWDWKTLPSLTGKVALVTGANAPESVGWHVAYQLALLNAKVFVGARNLVKAESGIQKMLEILPNVNASNLSPFVADLGNFKEVEKAAKAFIAQEERLDILINNAAALSRPNDKDENGISISFGTNHLGPFLLTKTLLPLMIETSQQPRSDVRIINLTSTSHYEVPPTARYRNLTDFNQDFGNPDSRETNHIRYGYSKLANILFTKELQRRLDNIEVPILTISVNPGGVGTAGAAKSIGGNAEEKFKKAGALTPFQGAITPLFAAVHSEPREDIESFKGAFLLPWGGLKEPSELAQDEVLAKELWETSEKVLEKVLVG
ncbi:hypothetical protein COCVIDRAFT_116571 [Bipolaris victoriae FI3]|uniref:NAD(P)-binding protein n=1 Tax=Bipolaris victoriae (strain FI3) TaxID=930091 RepID=W7DQF4_BIPV3|nr:hypothetical protein COCVIDRAFT_116571 [Bipolaris victoriae FI3]